MTLTARRAARPLLIAAALAAGTSLLSACAPLVVGAAAGGTALVATDRRTAGVQLEDQNIGFKVESNMRRHFGDTARINASAYQTKVLLTGEAPNETVKQQASEIAGKVENVTHVYNQLNIGPVSSAEARTNDTWLGTKVRTALINTKGVPSRTLTVTVERGVVYLQGKVTRLEGDYASAAAANVSGVKQVVRLLDVMTPEEERALAESQKNPGSQKSQAAPITHGSEPAQEAAPQTLPSSGVEVMPIQ
ncbi:21 kDa hemolysin precursor [plant metagenome]|uniref:21 kDa hemolysin n=1 Tax=plant metagenome TaxID=1297885 RepID=A0A484Q0S2_9ZZZZ